MSDGTSNVSVTGTSVIVSNATLATPFAGTVGVTFSFGPTSGCYVTSNFTGTAVSMTALSMGTTAFVSGAVETLSNVAGSTTFNTVSTVANSSMYSNDPLVAGSTASVYRVNALLRGGMSISQVQEDFPSLTTDQIQAANNYAVQNPNPDAQYPEKSFKKYLLGLSAA